jgi:hypothetical protein
LLSGWLRGVAGERNAGSRLLKNWSEPRSLIPVVLVTALAATALNSLFIVASYHAVSVNGSAILLWYTLPLVLPLVIALFGVVTSLLLLPFRATRKAATGVFAVAAVYLAIGVLCVSIGSKVRIRGFERLVERSRPLISAVRRFEAENKRPPTSLAELVPKYLAVIPNTGMAAYPEYEYVTGDQALENYDGNPWAVWVDTPSGGINWDILIYYPKQNYPRRGHGGSLERVKDWAYVHE